MTIEDMLKRSFISARDILRFLPEDLRDEDLAEEVAVDVKYGGYLVKEAAHRDEMRKMEEKKLPEGINYLSMGNLRIEARQKLDKIRPMTLGQASRISGVSPADIAVLITYLVKGNQ